MNTIANTIREARGDDFTTSDDQFARFYSNLSRLGPVDRRRRRRARRDDRRLRSRGLHQERTGPGVHEVVFADPRQSGGTILRALLEALETRARAIAAADARRREGLPHVWRQ